MFNVYHDFLFLADYTTTILVLRFLPDNFYGGNHGVAIKGSYNTKDDVKYVTTILEYLCKSQKELFFFVEYNNIHFGNHQIKIFTVSYADEFSNVGDLLARWSELCKWYKYKGFLREKM